MASLDQQQQPMRHIKLMNDYSVHLPLWGHVDEAFPHLSWNLLKSLQALAKRFGTHFHWDGGWDDNARGVRHRNHMQSAFQRLKSELGPTWNVTLDLWECYDNESSPE